MPKNLEQSIGTIGSAQGAHHDNLIQDIYDFANTHKVETAAAGAALAIGTVALIATKGKAIGGLLKGGGEEAIAGTEKLIASRTPLAETGGAALVKAADKDLIQRAAELVGPNGSPADYLTALDAVKGGQRTVQQLVAKTEVSGRVIPLSERLKNVSFGLDSEANAEKLLKSALGGPNELAKTQPWMNKPLTPTTVDTITEMLKHGSPIERLQQTSVKAAHDLIKEGKVPTPEAIKALQMNPSWMPRPHLG